MTVRKDATVTPIRQASKRPARAVGAKKAAAKKAAASAPKPPRTRKPKPPVEQPKPEPLSLLAAVDAAVAGMDWLQPSDAGLVAVARKYAQSIDEADDVVKQIGWTGPHLVNALRALGGAPAERKALGVEAPVKGALAKLRAARGASA